MTVWGGRATCRPILFAAILSMPMPSFAFTTIGQW
jgi:hypothetical protein